jgi:plasmid replication initiation protein
LDSNNLVTKSNSLITAQYDLSVEEQKIILTLASMVQIDDKEFEPYTFKIKNFMELIGITTKTRYTTIPQLAKKLMKKVFEINEGDKTLVISWLSSAEYTRGSGQVTLCFDPKLKPLLLKLNSLFTTYRLENILKLKSKYSIRIYEILKSSQFKRQGYVTIKLDDLRKTLGIKAKEYSRFYNFKQRVLEHSQNELALYTDITFNFEEIREGLKVSAIKFYIRTNNQNYQDSKGRIIGLDQKEPDNIIDKINKTLGVSFHLNALKKLIELKGIEKINYYLDNWNRFDCSNKSNIAGFFYKAILEEWEIPQKGFARPIQATNYKQREYDDEYFDSLYDN